MSDSLHLQKWKSVILCFTSWICFLAINRSLNTVFRLFVSDILYLHRASWVLALPSKYRSSTGKNTLRRGVTPQRASFRCVFVPEIQLITSYRCIKQIISVLCMWQYLLSIPAPRVPGGSTPPTFPAQIWCAPGIFMSRLQLFQCTGNNEDCAALSINTITVLPYHILPSLLKSGKLRGQLSPRSHLIVMQTAWWIGYYCAVCLKNHTAVWLLTYALIRVISLWRRLLLAVTPGLLWSAPQNTNSASCYFVKLTHHISAQLNESAKWNLHWTLTAPISACYASRRRNSLLVCSIWTFPFSPSVIWGEKVTKRRDNHQTKWD